MPRRAARPAAPFTRPSAARPKAGAKFRVTLRAPDGRELTVVVRQGETLLDAAGRAGLTVPFDCCSGTCCICIARVVDGAVAHRLPPQPRSGHLKEQYCLTCLAMPESDCVIELPAHHQARCFQAAPRRSGGCGRS